ncbi:7-cyano-7-deazaguanine reductase [candidate division WOR_3 bacterium SM23_42]|uniref:NADPH-dependent 7-cyano-7-deazaguanine reductase n=1 Tax=candidate division WOR_3 bacterium SM23_42 TaxID=1703779 RepID=A0A0S8FTY2_UNCW3|nr:MAG: 7-cyano-7-deazaguanine reductase [candidate division WOR_3 bacterium SM23_42]
MSVYKKKHAVSGLREKLPGLVVLPNQFRGYRITIMIPEYTSLCPRTGLPDAGTITIEYEPDASFVELKSLKLYILGYRNMGIFYENAVNRILKDFVKAVKPRWAVVRGEFNPRGGITSTVEAKYGRKRK